MITKKYNYQHLDRNINTNGKREYIAPTGHLPSVTTILNATKPAESEAGLENWRQRIGHKNAKQITTEAADVGTLMHASLEDYINDTNTITGNNFIHALARTMAETVVAKGMCNVSEVYGCEVPLYFEDMYAGTTDCIGLWRDKVAIIDFKQTLRPKNEQWVGDYKMQLTAYAMAHNHMFDTDITTGVIMMCSQDLTYQEFIIDNKAFEAAQLEWVLRLQKYYDAN